MVNHGSHKHVLDTLLMPILMAVACAVALASGVTSPPMASAATATEQSIINEAAKYGLSVQFVANGCSGSTACYTGSKTITFNSTKMASITVARLVDFTRHEAAHYQIDKQCGTPGPNIASGARHHKGNNATVDLLEYVTDMYAYLYNGMALANGWYAYDSLVTAAERDTYSAMATQIHNGNCWALPPAPSVDFDGNGIPDDQAMQSQTDLNRDGYPDIIGFGNDSVSVSLSKQGTGFNSPTTWGTGKRFALNGGWTVENPRTVIDMNNDGYPDIVGFGPDSVYVALNNNGTGFKTATGWLSDTMFTTSGGWSTKNNPRVITDVNNDGYPDIVGFGNGSVIVSLNNNGTGFKQASSWLDGGMFTVNGSWKSDNPRVVTDVNNDGYPDIVGFGNNNVIIALNKNGVLQPLTNTVANFGPLAGIWHVGLHPRLISA